MAPKVIPRESRLCGFVNVGNTCFANAALQVMFSSKLFLERILAHVEPPCPLAVYGCVACSLVDDFTWTTSTDTHTPRAVLDQLPKLMPGMRRHSQQDSHAFFLSLLNETNTFLGDHHFEIGRQVWLTKCSACSHEVPEVSEFWNICLRVQRTVDGALTEYFGGEEMSAENAVTCRVCGERMTPIRSLKLMVTPEILILQLARFQYEQRLRRSVRVEASTKIPLMLDLSRHRDVNSPPRLDDRLRCVGMVLHYGDSPNAGHYKANVRSSRGKWHLFDDDRVKPLNRHEVMDRNDIYYAVYERMPADGFSPDADESAGPSRARMSSPPFRFSASPPTSRRRGDAWPIPRTPATPAPPSASSSRRAMFSPNFISPAGNEPFDQVEFTPSPESGISEGARSVTPSPERPVPTVTRPASRPVERVLSPEVESSPSHVILTKPTQTYERKDSAGPPQGAVVSASFVGRVGLPLVSSTPLTPVSMPTSGSRTGPTSGSTSTRMPPRLPEPFPGPHLEAITPQLSRGRKAPLAGAGELRDDRGQAASARQDHLAVNVTTQRVAPASRPHLSPEVESSPSQVIFTKPSLTYKRKDSAGPPQGAVVSASFVGRVGLPLVSSTPLTAVSMPTSGSRTGSTSGSTSTGMPPRLPEPFPGPDLEAITPQLTRGRRAPVAVNVTTQRVPPASRPLLSPEVESSPSQVILTKPSLTYVRKDSAGPGRAPTSLFGSLVTAVGPPGDDGGQVSTTLRASRSTPISLPTTGSRTGSTSSSTTTRMSSRLPEPFPGPGLEEVTPQLDSHPEDTAPRFDWVTTRRRAPSLFQPTQTSRRSALSGRSSSPQGQAVHTSTPHQDRTFEFPSSASTSRIDPIRGHSGSSRGSDRSDSLPIAGRLDFTADSAHAGQSLRSPSLPFGSSPGPGLRGRHRTPSLSPPKAKLSPLLTPSPGDAYTPPSASSTRLPCPPRTDPGNPRLACTRLTSPSYWLSKLGSDSSDDEILAVPRCYFQCSECEDMFATEKALVRHELQHSLRPLADRRYFPCRHCGKLYPYLHRLHSHLRLHNKASDNRYLRCPLRTCEAEYRNYARFTRHEEHHVAFSTDLGIFPSKKDVKTRKDHTCRTCKEEFEDCKSKNRHMKALGDRGKRIECRTCERRRKRGQKMKVRLVIRHWKHTVKWTNFYEIVTKEPNVPPKSPRPHRDEPSKTGRRGSTNQNRRAKS